MIRPNTLSNRAEDSALARVEAIVERIDDTPVQRYAISGLSVPERATHARLLAELEVAADRCGRRDLLDDVRDRVQGRLISRFAPLAYLGSVAYPIPLHSTARPQDEALVVSAIVDAVAVALLEDRLDLRTAAQLSATGRQLLGLPPLDPDAADASPPSVEEPTAADWAEAADGDTQTGGYSPIPVGLRVGLATVAAVLLAPIAVFVGVGIGQTGAGILAGLAIVAVCWLIATYRR